MPTLLVTGGAGFIGSHTVLILLSAGYNLVILDNFSNSSLESLRRIAKIIDLKKGGNIEIINGDIRSRTDLNKAFNSAPANSPIEAVIHFAGLKSVSESIEHPLRYWDVNVNGSCQLISVMQKHGCRTLVFSSSATLYGIPQETPIPESSLIQPINPYGHSKEAVEKMLDNLFVSESTWRIARLRYFNPVGAHPSGYIGEDPLGPPNNLFPFVSQVACGRRSQLLVFGGDWPTEDGSGVRDYIHVMDLAEGHLAALKTLLLEPPQMLTLNLGSGQGYSVLEVVNEFERASGRDIPYEIVARRPGDAPKSIADPSKAHERLGWKTKRCLVDMCRDSWNWQIMNPNGYQTKN